MIQAVQATHYLTHVSCISRPRALPSSRRPDQKQPCNCLCQGPQLANTVQAALQFHFVGTLLAICYAMPTSQRGNAFWTRIQPQALHLFVFSAYSRDVLIPVLKATCCITNKLSQLSWRPQLCLPLWLVTCNRPREPASLQQLWLCNAKLVPCLITFGEHDI